MTDRQLLWRVELPLAVPEIIAGLRIATVSTVAIATLAVFAGGGGLGSELVAGSNITFKTGVVIAERPADPDGDRLRRPAVACPAAADAPVADEVHGADHAPCPAVPDERVIVPLAFLDSFGGCDRLHLQPRSLASRRRRGGRPRPGAAT